MERRAKLRPERQASGAEERELMARMEECRRRIDLLDEELVRLLNARAACALEVGQVKDRLGLDTYQPAREVEVLRHVRSTNGGPLDADAITRLFERIIDEARRLERVSQGDRPSASRSETPEA